MIDEAALSNWPGGINNRAPDNRLPDGFVRDMLNLDPGSLLRSRVGYERVAPCTAARAVMALGSKVLYVDGVDLMEFDASTDTTRKLATVAGAGPVASVVHNDELFIATANETLRYDGELREWGVPDVLIQPAAGVDTVQPGRCLYAMTYVNAYGEEGGTVSAVSTPYGGLTITVPTLPDGCKARIYVSAVNGKTLYLQREVTTPGPVYVGTPQTDTATLATMHMSRPRPGGYLASVGGSIAVASGSMLYATAPFWPHLVDMSRHFTQYPDDIGMVVSGLHGVYVSSDKCYLLTGVETDSPQQRTVMDYPAVSGTGTILPSGQAAWVTQYGMAIEDTDPRKGVTEPNRQNFVAGNHERGATGVFDHDGDQMMVATMKRSEGQGTLAACDYFEAEVIRP